MTHLTRMKYEQKPLGDGLSHFLNKRGKPNQEKDFAVTSTFSLFSLLEQCGT